MELIMRDFQLSRHPWSTLKTQRRMYQKRAKEAGIANPEQDQEIDEPRGSIPFCPEHGSGLSFEEPESYIVSKCTIQASL
jgi:hypothetical protein